MSGSQYRSVPVARSSPDGLSVGMFARIDTHDRTPCQGKTFYVSYPDGRGSSRQFFVRCGEAIGPGHRNTGIQICDENGNEEAGWMIEYGQVETVITSNAAPPRAAISGDVFADAFFRSIIVGRVVS